METIRCYSQMTIDLGCRARLLVTECTDGWNIEILNPADVRIGIHKQGGIHFKYVTQVMDDAEKFQEQVARRASQA